MTDNTQHNILHTNDIQISNISNHTDICINNNTINNNDNNNNNNQFSSYNEHEHIVMKNKVENLELELGNISESEINIEIDVPDMWSKEYIGLYAQYAAVGLLYGSSGTLFPFCIYTYNGDSNLCSNSKNIMFFAWSFKLFFAILTDCYYPLGYRRKAWMCFGWCGVLLLLFILTLFAHQLSVSTWLLLLVLVQGFLMISDVPADGYCVALGKLERPEQRGQILATGQMVRFVFCMFAGLIQTVLLNGPSTNASDCAMDAGDCWAWGLNVNGYYGLLFVLILIITLPVWYLKEVPVRNATPHSLKHFVTEIWEILQNLTTFYLMVFVVELTNLEAGVNTMTTYGAMVTAIYLFKTYLINRNWRYTQYGSTLLTSFVGFLWIFAFYDIGGAMNPWFTIFIDIDTQFAAGLAQVLYSMAVIELAKPGLEATTYELIVTAGNAALTVNGIIATQLLTPFKAIPCDDDSTSAESCPHNTVDVSSKQTFIDSNGPYRFTVYTITLLCISLIGCAIVTSFLPKSKAECHAWKTIGMQKGNSVIRGYVTTTIAIVTILYGVAAGILLLDVDTACLAIVGGSGC